MLELEKVIFLQDLKGITKDVRDGPSPVRAGPSQ